MRQPRDHTKRQFNPTSKRLREMENLIRLRNTEAGRFCMPADEGKKFLIPVARHLLRLRRVGGRPTSKIELVNILSFWVGRWLPEIAERVDVLAKTASFVMRCPQTEKADQLGVQLALKDRERDYLKITMIAASDVTPAERGSRRRDRKRKRDRDRAAEKRRLQGVKARGAYLAECLTATRPWDAEGVSRRTWERRRKTSDTPLH